MPPRFFSLFGVVTIGKVCRVAPCRILSMEKNDDAERGLRACEGGCCDSRCVTQHRARVGSSRRLQVRTLSGILLMD